MNTVYREYFPTEPPTRATVGVTALAADYRVEIEVIAVALVEPVAPSTELVDRDVRVAGRADDLDRERVLAGRSPSSC